MENDATDYLSFIRGFRTAINHDSPEDDEEPSPDRGRHLPAFSAGFTAGSRRWEPIRDYRELSTQDHGRFTGTLDLAGKEQNEPALSGVLDLSTGRLPGSSTTARP